MNTRRSCQDCGAELPTAATEGLCPRCLLGTAAALSGLEPPTDLAESPPPGVAVGTRRFGNYELIEEIASGGMGVVYKARQASLNRVVALKTLPFGRFTRETAVRRFRAEAEAAAKLRHPNIVAIHEVGEQDGQPYFSMDYVAGPNLAEVARDQPLAPARAARFVRTIAEAVQYAHGMGILHRDLKPSNILIDALDQPHITDFGLAKNLQNGRDLTLTGQTLGSPNYMPPEQIEGSRGQAGPPSDVYSLGAMLYHLLTGRPPFVSDSLTTTLHQVASSEPVAPRLLNPAVSRDLETICLKCLEKDPGKRYRTAQELAEELGRWRADEPIRARPAGPWQRGARWCRRRPVLAAALAAIVLLGFGLVAGLSALILRTREAALARRFAQVEAIHSHLENARSWRRSGRAGRRLEALASLRKASALAPGPEDRLELRNEAIACLALTDIRPGKSWRIDSEELDSLVRFDARQEIYARPGPEGGITVRRAANDAQVAYLPFPGTPRRWIKFFSPDGRFLASNHERDEVCIWEIAAARIVLRLPRDAGFAFTPDSRHLAVSREDQSYALVSLETFQEETRLGLGVHFGEIRFDPGGERFFGIPEAGEWIERRDTRTGQLQHRFRVPGVASCAAVSADGHRLAVGTDRGHIVVWDTDSGTERWVRPIHDNFVSALAFDHRGDLLASISWDGTLRLSDSASGTVILNESGIGWQIEFRPDDRQLAHVRSEKEFRLLEVVPPGSFHLLHPPVERESAWTLAFTPDGRHLAVGKNAGVRFWESGTWRETGYFKVFDARSVIFPADGRSVITSGDPGVFRWPLTSPTNAEPLSIGPAERLIGASSVVQAALAGDRHLLVADIRNHRALFHDLQGERPPLSLGGMHFPQNVALSRDGRLAAISGTHTNAQVAIWNTAPQEHLADLLVTPGATLAFSPDGRWLAVSGQGEKLYDTAAWAVVREFKLKSPTPWPKQIAFSHDGRLFATANSPYDIQLFDPATGARLAILTPPQPSTVSALAFSPDNQRLAVLQWNSDVQIWDLAQLHRELAELGLDWGTDPADAPAKPDRP